jgi:hypothetical protein
MRKPRLDAEGLEAALRNLPRLSRQSLAEQWGALYGAPPPARTSRQLMIRAIAYKLQEQVHGGLSPATRRLLLGDADSANKVPRVARAGTVFVREWQGVTHQVSVIESGVIYRGQRYRSLSEVARRITGARWSGPRFFGLHDQA